MLIPRSEMLAAALSGNQLGDQPGQLAVLQWRQQEPPNLHVGGPELGPMAVCRQDRDGGGGGLGGQLLQARPAVGARPLQADHDQAGRVLGGHPDGLGGAWADADPEACPVQGHGIPREHIELVIDDQHRPPCLAAVHP